ncbi:exosome complex component RRP42-like [Salmo trutta]|uniref:exosome complex component RRP42-like n=1 Tax=Salmo trutta TaxID=8032 RepID=UPI001131D1E8|nr:exosome complex component RRP42-like [Salmo trutta]
MFVTLVKFGQFSHCLLFVVDATLQEKVCSVVSLIISVTHKGTVTCVRKVGGGSLDPESIFEMTETGKQVGKAILMKLLQKEESLGKKRQKIDSSEEHKVHNQKSRCETGPFPLPKNRGLEHMIYFAREETGPKKHVCILLHHVKTLPRS